MCAYIPLVFLSPLQTVLPLRSVSCGDSQICRRETGKLRRREGGEREGEGEGGREGGRQGGREAGREGRREREGGRKVSYGSLDRFCDGLSKCHLWFASDAGTVVLCTHSLGVCVGGGVGKRGGRWDGEEGGREGGGGRLVNK